MPRNKLTLEQVKKVFTEYKHLSGRKISKMYNVSHATVNQIRSGRTWQNEIAWLKVLEPETFGHLSPKGEHSPETSKESEPQTKA